MLLILHLFSVIRVLFIDVINYSTVRVRPTLSEITATRSPVLAIFLANRHDNTKLILCVNGNDGGVAADCKSVPSW